MKELIFGADLIKILKKNGYNEIGNTVTKYKNGSKSIFFMYSMISNIDKLKVDTPFIQFDVDDETDGLIDIVCFPNGEKGDGIECKSEKDILWFIENANWKNSDLMESKNKDVNFFNNMSKKYNFTKEEKTRYNDKTYISVIGVLFDRINNAIKMFGRNSDEEYNALNDCWDAISTAKSNGFDVSYEEKKWNSIAGLPNYH